MAITTIAPTRRAEYAIYTILPVSIGFWLATKLTGDIPADPFKALGIVAIATTIGTVLLAEIGLDEWLAKHNYRTLTYEEHRNLQWIFLSWNAYQETWNTTPMSVPAIIPHSVDLAGQVDYVMQGTVSSHPVEQQLWRIRAFYFLIISLLVLADTVGMSFTYYFPWIAEQLPLGLLLVIEICLYICVAWVLYRVSRYRHRNLRSYITRLATFRFLHRLVVFYSSPKSDIPYREKEREKMKLDLIELDSILARGDLLTFIQIWEPIQDDLSYRLSREFEDKVAERLMAHWARHIKISKNKRADEHAVIESGRSFGWLIHYAYEGIQLVPRDPQDPVRQLIEYLFDKYLECTGGEWSPRECWPVGRVQTFIRLLKTFRTIIRPRPRIIEYPDLAKMRMECLADSSLLYEQMPNDILGTEFSKEVAHGIRLLFEDPIHPEHEVIGRSMAFTASALAGLRHIDVDEKKAIEVFLRYLHQTYEAYLRTSDRTQIWSMKAAEKLEFLDRLYEKILKHDEKDQRGFVLAQFFKEASWEICVEALQPDQLWYNELDLYPVKDYLLMVHSGEVRKRDDEFRSVVTTLVERKDWSNETYQVGSDTDT